MQKTFKELEMKKILLVEDTLPVGKMIQKRLENSGDFSVTWVQTMAECVALLQERAYDFFIAILDFNLPDAHHGEVIAKVVHHNLPTIVFTGYVSEEVREKVWSHNVVDYVLKEDVLSLDYILNLLDRLEKNATTRVLLVDSDHDNRQNLSALLRVHRYHVLTADSGEQALEIMEEDPDIKLTITASKLPGMGGLDLIQQIRKKFCPEDMAIVGMVSKGDHITSARFLKYGANDFFVKETFLPEEFYGRINHLLSTLEHIQLIRTSALKDFLTGLSNRRYFFMTGEKLYASAKRDNLSLVCAMFDIDFFKKVNDSHGHEAGDLVLKQVAKILQKRMRKTDIVARMGGEEFCILAVNMDINEASRIFNELRTQIEQAIVVLPDTMEKVQVTISCGICTTHTDSLENMVKKADFSLYKAKEGGRNQVVADI